MISTVQKYHREGWITRLESGGYDQVQHKMVAPLDTPENDEGGEIKIGYCCLGVAEVEAGYAPVANRYGDWTINGQASRMSVETAFSMGFLERNPFLWAITFDLEDRIQEYERDNRSQFDEDFTISRTSVPLSFLNDKLNLSFQQIARILRAQPDHWTGVSLTGESL
jgi:hypothetical protein